MNVVRQSNVLVRPRLANSLGCRSFCAKTRAILGQVDCLITPVLSGIRPVNMGLDFKVLDQEVRNQDQIKRYLLGFQVKYCKAVITV